MYEVHGDGVMTEAVRFMAESKDSLFIRLSSMDPMVKMVDKDHILFGGKVLSIQEEEGKFFIEIPSVQ